MYELVPEAYRQRFRNLKKTQVQTCVDFSREMGILFDRWCSACKVEDLASLRELVLIEQFKYCMPERTVIYLNEQKVTTLQQAAVLADELSLMRKNIFVSPEAYSRGDFPSPRGSASRMDDRRVFQARPLPSKVAEVCHYCKKPGHIMSQCFVLRRKEEAKATAQRPKGVGLIKTVSCHNQNDSLRRADKCFKPFIYDGFVSLSGEVSDQRPVKILRDTGGSQSFILSAILPLSDQSACNSSAIVRGIEMGFVPGPLHKVHVKSGLVTVFFPCGCPSRFSCRWS